MNAEPWVTQADEQSIEARYEVEPSCPQFQEGG